MIIQRLLFPAAVLTLLACASSDTHKIGESTSGGGSGGSGGASVSSTIATGGAASSSSSVASASSTGGSGGSQAGVGGSGGAGGDTYCDWIEPCTHCLYEKCNADYCRCYDEPDCKALASCILQCSDTDDSCLEDCASQYPNGTADAFLAASCIPTTCADSCPAGVPEINDCERCVLTDCKDESNACLSDFQCNEVAQCAIGCDSTDQACLDACVGDNQAAATNAKTLESCLQAKCATTCNGSIGTGSGGSTSSASTGSGGSGGAGGATN